MSTPVMVMMTWSPATAQEAGSSLTASAVERDQQKNTIQLHFEQQGGKEQVIVYFRSA